MPAPSSGGMDAGEGVSSDMIMRQQIVGQVMTALDGVETAMKSLKSTMEDVREYGGCDYNMTGCTGPKRVAAFKKKARAFMEPYDNVLDSLESSLYTAIAAGIDITNIYMMLTNSCNQWGKYLCNKKNVEAFIEKDGKKVQNPDCTLVQLYNPNQGGEIQQNWMQISEDGDDTKTRMACISDNVFTQGIFARQARRKQNAINIDTLEYLLNYDEPKGKIPSNIGAYCWPNDVAVMEEALRKISAGTFTDKKVNGVGDFDSPFGDWDGKCTDANPCFGLCSTHAYNLGETSNKNVKDKDKKNDLDNLIGLKSTAIAMTMKRNYDTLATTVKQIRIQMQKAVMTAATSTGESSNNSAANQINCISGVPADVISCVNSNMSKLASMSLGDFRKACKNLRLAILGAGVKSSDIGITEAKCDSVTSATKNEIIAEIGGALNILRREEANLTRPIYR